MRLDGKQAKAELNELLDVGKSFAVPGQILNSKTEVTG